MAATEEDHQQKKAFLTCGFVRETCKPQNNHDAYPESLIQAIITWTEDIFIRFNAVHNEFEHLIQTNGTLIKRGHLDYQMTSEQYQQHAKPNCRKCLDNVQDRNIIIGSNCFFMDKGIYEWNIKVSGSTFNQDKFVLNMIRFIGMIGIFVGKLEHIYLL